MKYIKICFNFAVSIVLLFLLFHELHLPNLSATFQHLQYRWLLLSLITQLLSITIFSVRWSYIMAKLNFKEKLTYYIKLNFLGSFFSQLLPTSIGGDAIRTVKLASHGYPKWQSISAIFIDRVYGITGLLILNACTLPWIVHLLPSFIFYSILSITIIGFFGLMALSAYKYAYPLNKIKLFNFYGSLSKQFIQTLKGTHTYRFKLLLLSIIPNLLTFISAYYIACAIQIPISFIDLIAIMPTVILITLIPISFAGWGIRESALVFLLEYFGVIKAQSFSLSIIFGIMMIIASLPGAFFLLSKSTQK